MSNIKTTSVTGNCSMWVEREIVCFMKTSNFTLNATPQFWQQSNSLQMYNWCIEIQPEHCCRELRRPLNLAQYNTSKLSQVVSRQYAANVPAANLSTKCLDGCSRDQV